MLVYRHDKKRWKIVESSIILNHITTRDHFFFFFFFFSQFVSLFGQIGAEKLLNPFLKIICLSNAACNPEQVLAATPHKTPLYGHLPPITKTIQVRRTRHAGHCWRSRDELIRDVLLWIPTHGRAKAGRPARTYIQQLCEDTGCCPEDLPRAMNDREEWRERSGISVLPVRYDDDDDDIYLYKQLD